MNPLRDLSPLGLAWLRLVVRVTIGFQLRRVVDAIARRLP